MNLTKYFLSASMDEQINRSLSNFSDKNKDLKTRVKSLQNLTKFYQDNQEELIKLYNVNYIEIFDLLYFSLIRLILFHNLNQGYNIFSLALKRVHSI